MAINLLTAANVMSVIFLIAVIVVAFMKKKTRHSKIYIALCFVTGTLSFITATLSICSGFAAQSVIYIVCGVIWFANGCLRLTRKS